MGAAGRFTGREKNEGKGDTIGYAGACERYGDAVFRLAWSCTGSRQERGGHNQTVFLKVLERRARHLEPGKERAWLFRVAVNSTAASGGG